ncbi:MAG: TIGR00282 family metallophosphoesterase [Bacilli bacterium]|nr:TIGR00282 family metallophosphoesterase [Bacilli bacterium]
MIKILFIGDIVGKAGRETLAHFLPSLKEEHDFDLVIANGENVTHGRGLNKRHYLELMNLGVDVITLGNHFDDREELRSYIEKYDNIARPLNLIANYPGKGSVVVTTKKGDKVRVTNILGQAFMKEVITSPLLALKLVNLDSEPMIHIVDYHAEATAEKMTIAWEFDGTISALLGTHTHVQTVDARLLHKGTAYISDVGMTGAYDGVIGAERNSVIQKVWFDKKSPFNYDNEDVNHQFSAVILEIDKETFKTKKITPIYKLWTKYEQ